MGEAIKRECENCGWWAYTDNYIHDLDCENCGHVIRPQYLKKEVD